MLNDIGLDIAEPIWAITQPVGSGVQVLMHPTITDLKSETFYETPGGLTASCKTLENRTAACDEPSGRTIQPSRISKVCGMDSIFIFLDRIDGIDGIFFACGESSFGRRTLYPYDPVDPVQFLFKDKNPSLFFRTSIFAFLESLIRSNRPLRRQC